MRVKQILVILTFWFVGMFLVIAPAEAIMLMPDVDGSLTDHEKNGSIDYVDQGAPAIFDSPSGELESRGILEFDISSLSGSISSASLDLSVNHFFGSTEIGLYFYNGDGVLSELDYGAGILIDSFNYSSAADLQIDVTDSVQSSITNNNNFIGFNLRMEYKPGIGTTAIIFYSLETPTGSPQPGLLNIVE